LASDKVPGGFSTRCAIAATPSTSPITLQAELQALPTAARALTKRNLRSDNCVIVQIARIPLRVDMFDGMEATSPVPSLFAPNRVAAFTGLMKNLSEALHDVLHLNQTFLFMEHVTLEDAAIYLQGQARRAKGIAAFQPKSLVHPPSSKKPKLAGSLPSRSSIVTSSTGKTLTRLLLYLRLYQRIGNTVTILANNHTLYNVMNMVQYVF
jgi:hypothetical protein